MKRCPEGARQAWGSRYMPQPPEWCVRNEICAEVNEGLGSCGARAWASVLMDTTQRLLPLRRTPGSLFIAPRPSYHSPKAYDKYQSPGSLYLEAKNLWNTPFHIPRWVCAVGGRGATAGDAQRQPLRLQLRGYSHAAGPPRSVQGRPRGFRLPGAGAGGGPPRPQAQGLPQW